jgi:hypothetical protein
MSSSRREFLKRGTWMALAAGVPLSLSEHVLGMGAAPTSAGLGLDRAAFEKQLHTRFVLNHDAAKVSVTLVDVTNLASQAQTEAGKEAFSLVFRGPKQTTLRQNTYLIEHEKLGMFSFLIVPVRTRDKSAPHYEAIINRLYS